MAERPVILKFPEPAADEKSPKHPVGTPEPGQSNDQPGGVRACLEEAAEGIEHLTDSGHHSSRKAMLTRRPWAERDGGYEAALQAGEHRHAVRYAGSGMPTHGSATVKSLPRPVDENDGRS